jgi:predicted regulator of Ras-like GTPase activity (Roadblock/LC7/MglB family)
LENPEIRVLLELRRELDEQLTELREKADQIESYIQALDSVIGVSSFATADAAIGAAATADALGARAEEGAAALTSDEPRTIQVMNKPGDLELAIIELDTQTLSVTPASHAIYDIKRGAFARFFVERILGQFQQEDRHRVENGEIEWEQAFDFEVRADEGVLQQIVIRNYGEGNRLNEIQNTLRWALEKIYRAR